MGVRSHRGLRSTCLLIQSRTQQLSAASCRLYSLLLPPGAELDPEEEAEAEPLVCLAAPLSFVMEAAGGLMEAGPLKVNPYGGKTEKMSSYHTQPTANQTIGILGPLMWTRKDD